MVDGNQANGKVMTSDANGTATWQALPAAISQTLSISGDSLSISGGNTVSLASVGGNTLDGAYNEGGAGAGRTITADAGAVLVQGTDGLQVTGTFGSGTALALSGAGTRMFFYPAKAAFRAGRATSTEWDAANVGNYSAAFGENNRASGSHTFVSGYGNTAAGDRSMVSGFASSANGVNSFAGGYVSHAQLNHSIAFGWGDSTFADATAAFGINNKVTGFAGFAANADNVVAGTDGAAFGLQNTLNGAANFAAGSLNTTNGDQSAAFGYANNTTADQSFVTGTGNNATGNTSFMGGAYNYAPSYSETALGMYGTTYTAASSTAYSGADRVFNVGNGTSTSSRSDAFTILKNGNVGVGINAPTTKLHVAGSIRMVDGYQATGFVMISDANGVAKWTSPTAITNNSWGITGNSGTSATSNFIGTTDGTDLVIKTNNSEQMRVTTGGNLGVGTTNPTQAKVVINGSQNSTLSYGYLNSSGSVGTTSSTTAYSLYASARIAATEFNAYSDERIKKIRAISNSAEDLNTLTKIRITDYNFIDTIAKGNGISKKVIAQQVENVYPQAVSKITDVIPNIYQVAEIHNGYIAVNNKLHKGDLVKLIFENHDELTEVISADTTGFTVNVKAEGKVFVFGKQVTDFRTVDYEALTTLNISATQELLKRINKLDAENKALKSEINELQTGKADAGTVNQLQLQIEELKLFMHKNSTISEK